MVDPTKMELEAMRHCKLPLSEVLTEIGWNVPPRDWTDDQVMRLIDAIVTDWEGRPPF